MVGVTVEEGVLRRFTGRGGGGDSYGEDWEGGCRGERMGFGARGIEWMDGVWSSRMPRGTPAQMNGLSKGWES